MKNKIISLVLMAVMIITCFASCSSYNIQDDNAQDNTDSNTKSNPQEITIGYSESSDDNSKPLPSQRIALKCLSFYEKNEKVIVDVAMGDQYSHFQEYGGSPSYDTFESNGYPIFEVYLGNDTNWDVADDEDILLINGKTGAFEKKFSKEDMIDLDITENIDIVSKYLHENIELDFNKFNVGDSGTVVFSFGWFYDHDNPYNQSQPDNSWCGMRRTLSFYIGESGISLSFNSVDNAKDEYDNHLSATDNANTDAICAAKPLYLLCIDNNNMQYSHGSIIERQFKIISSYDETSYDVAVTSSEDIELLSESQFQIDVLSTNSISVQFKLLDQCETGNIMISVTPISDPKASSELEYAYYQNIYYCHDGYYDYVSLDSLDSLSVYSSRLANAIDVIDKQCEQIKITDIQSDGQVEIADPQSSEQVEQIEIADTQGNEQIEIDNTQRGGQIEIDDADNFELIGIPDTEIQATTATYTVKGYIKWKDSAGTAHPANGVSVYIYNKNGTSNTLLGTVSTNSTGYYSKSFSYDGTSKNIYIKVYSSGLGVIIRSPSLSNTYIYSSSTYNGITGGQSVTISYTASNTTDLGKSLSVHQAMTLANRYIYSLDGAYLKTITVSFPDSSKGTSCYSPSDGRIYILAGDAFDWDVLEHEYGHFVQNCYSIANSPGGNHSLSENLADARSNKSEGIRLAWGEGWATYFAINLQNKMSASSLNIPNVGDTRYQDTVDASIDYDIEFLPSNRRIGEANEATVSAVLYDITDVKNTASNENDNVYCSNKDVWNITKSSKATTLSEFITAFYNSGFTTQVKLNLGSTLSHYVVAAKLNTTPTGLTTSTPSFSWSKQGGSTLYPNNRFRLAFYNSSYNLILRTSYLNATSQTLTSSQWTQIKNSGSTVYCCVETYQTSTPQTGWYYSNLITLNLLTSGTYRITNVATGKCLNIYGENVTSLYNHQNVCLWSNSGTNEQKWYVTSIGNGAYIKSVIDQSFGLNVYRTGSPWNCDLLTISGNETDSQVDFIATSGGYKIKLHNYDLYLSADSSSNGANVYWSASSSSLYQVWSLTPV